MKPFTLTLLLLGSAVLAALSLPASAQDNSGGNALTIYSSARPGAVNPELYRSDGSGQPVPGYAVVRQQREFALNRGRNTVRFTDVAALIDPTTVSFQSLTDPIGTSVIEQNFQFDLVNTKKLLQKYVDRRISVDQVRGNSTESFAGILLSTNDDGLVLKRDDGSIQTLPYNAGIRLPELPGGLITRPTLVWDVNANRAATHNTQVSYQTTGITWWTDYNVTYQEGANANSCKLDVAAWVSIINQSGAGYPDAKLKLVAGDVQRAQPQGRVYAATPQRAGMAMEMSAKGFEEKAFFEYHLYTLGRPTTLPDNSTKQIELFPAARAVPCEKNLVYYGATARPYASGPAIDRNYGINTNAKVDVYIGFKNAKEQNMGMPLPAGRMRVSKLDDADNTLEFIGENTIDHTARNEQVLIKLGSAFDVVGQRRQANFNIDAGRQIITEEIEVKLRNQKKEAVTVMVKENLYRWSNWQISSKTHDYRKDDARTVTFPVKIAAGAEAVVRYTVMYTW